MGHWRRKEARETGGRGLMVRADRHQLKAAAASSVQVSTICYSRQCHKLQRALQHTPFALVNLLALKASVTSPY